MQTITITVGDDKTIIVDVEEDGQVVGEPYQCESAEECLQYVQSVMDKGPMADDSMADESMADESMADGSERSDYSSMWNEESKMRGQKMSQPGEY